MNIKNMDFYLSKNFTLPKKSKHVNNPLDLIFLTNPQCIENHKKITSTAYYYTPRDGFDTFDMSKLETRKSKQFWFNLNIQYNLNKEKITKHDLRCMTIYVNDNPSKNIDQKTKHQLNTLVKLLEQFGKENNVTWMMIPHFSEYTMHPTELSKYSPQNKIDLTIEEPHFHIIWHKNDNIPRKNALNKYLFEHTNILNNTGSKLIQLEFR